MNGVHIAAVVALIAVPPPPPSPPPGPKRPPLPIILVSTPTIRDRRVPTYRPVH